MIEFQRKSGPFIIKEIWFSDEVYDVKDVHLIQFRNANFDGDKPGFTKAVSTTLIIDLTKSIDDIWNGMNKNCRRQINLAQNDNITVRFNERIDEFFEMHQDFRKRRGLPATFITPEEIRKNYFLFTYEINGTLMGGHLCIKDDRRIRQLYSSSIRNMENGISQSVLGRANRLAIWEMIKHANKEGLVEYDFGGYATGKMAEELKGINEFKKSFGGVEVEKYTYTKSYSKLYNVSNSVLLGVSNIKKKVTGLKRKRKEMVRPDKENEKLPL
jgi:hypothetical protein